MKKIIPKEGKVTLSYDGYVRVYKHVIGYWSKNFVEGTSHYRPSPNEGRVWYSAKLNNDDYITAWSQAELRSEIVESGRKGIECDDY